MVLIIWVNKYINQKLQTNMLELIGFACENVICEG